MNTHVIKTPVYPLYPAKVQFVSTRFASQKSDATQSSKAILTPLIKPLDACIKKGLRAIDAAPDEASLKAARHAFFRSYGDIVSKDTDDRLRECYGDIILGHFAHEIVPPMLLIRDFEYHVRALERDHGIKLSLEQQKAYCRTLAQVTKAVLASYAMVFEGKSATPSQLWEASSKASMLHAITKGLNCTQLGQEYVSLLKDSPIQNTHDLYLIMRSFLVNAAKYTEKGHIHVSFVPGVGIIGDNTPKRVLMMQISDTGLGIPRKDQLNIFKGLRASNVRDSYIPGQAIGFEAAKQIIAKIKGSLFVQSPYANGDNTGFQEGTCITAYIPLGGNATLDPASTGVSPIGSPITDSLNLFRFVPDSKALEKLRLQKPMLIQGAVIGCKSGLVQQAAGWLRNHFEQLMIWGGMPHSPNHPSVILQGLESALKF